MNDSKEFINLEKWKKVPVIIKQKEYEISTRFSMNDSEKYITELSKKNDYKQAVAIIIFDRLQKDYGEECPSLQDILDIDENSFAIYIYAIVSTDNKLQKIFDETDVGLDVTRRFGLAYKSYMDILKKQFADAMRPALENYNRLIKSIDLSWVNEMQEFVNKMRPAWLDAMDGITQITQLVAKSMQPFQQIAASIATAISQISIPTVSEEQKEKWEEGYKRWGEIGWSVLPNAPFNFYNDFPNDTQAANKLAMRFCDKKSMEELFKKLHEQNIKKADINAAIFCYRHKQYKPCALMLFGIIDSKMIRKQPIIPDKRRSVGARAVKKIDKQLKGKSEEEISLIVALYQLNFITCLSVIFADGDDFRKEPPIINRNFINHGMNIREVRQRDCIQLFLILHNLLEFLTYFS